MPEIPYEKEAYYIFNRGYNDFSNPYKIERIEATFVIRAKKNLKFKQTSWKRRLPKNVLSDSIIEFTVYKSPKIIRFRLEYSSITMKSKVAHLFFWPTTWYLLLP